MSHEPSPEDRLDKLKRATFPAETKAVRVKRSLDALAQESPAMEFCCEDEEYDADSPLITAYAALEKAAEDWETECPKREDKQHCDCWYDGAACCACGDNPPLTREEMESMYIEEKGWPQVHGQESSVTFTIQSGPIKEFGVNGVQIDEVVRWAKQKIEEFNKAFPCRENSLAITKLDESLMWLAERKRNREQRGVEGQNKA